MTTYGSMYIRGIHLGLAALFGTSLPPSLYSILISCIGAWTLSEAFYEACPGFEMSFATATLRERDPHRPYRRAVFFF